MALNLVSTFSERLNEALGNMQATQLADKIGLSKQAISMYLHGTRSPKRPTIEVIARHLNVSPAWLMGYDVPKFMTDTETKVGFVPTNEFHRIPVVGSVRCGYGGTALQNITGYDFADVKNPDEYIFFDVKGDSMEPKIEEGDRALVHKQPDVESGELAIVVIDGEEGTLKKIIKNPDGSITLQAFNTKYPPRTFSGNDLELVCICGKVVRTEKRW